LQKATSQHELYDRAVGRARMAVEETETREEKLHDILLVCDTWRPR
jgi:hypothetical protein